MIKKSNCYFSNGVGCDIIIWYLKLHCKIIKNIKKGFTWFRRLLWITLSYWIAAENAQKR